MQTCFFCIANALAAPDASNSLVPVTAISVPRTKPLIPLASSLALRGNLTVGNSTPFIIDFGNSSVFKIPNNFTVSNGATVYAISTNPNVQAGTIRAYSIFNGLGATITSVLPEGGLPGYSNALSGFNLNLVAIRNLVNQGTISSAGSLSIVAGNQINNASTNSVIQAVNNLNVFSPNIVNQGTLASQVANVNINNSATYSTQMASLMNNSLAGLLKTNASLSGNGMISALQGSINIGDSFSNKLLFDVRGGDFLSKELNFNVGNGKLEALVNSASGPVNITACAANFGAHAGDLNLGTLTLTGDPTFYNTNGDISINGNISVGEALSLVASRNILTTGDYTITASDGIRGFEVNLIAGAKISADGANNTTTVDGSSSGKAIGPITIYGASATGGDIDFADHKMSIVTKATAMDSPGGNVRLIAFHDSGLGEQGGHILLSPDSVIEAGGVGEAVNGNITIIGGATGTGTAISTGWLRTVGSRLGDITIANAQPEISWSNKLVIGPDGFIRLGNDFKASSTAEAGDIMLNNLVIAGTGTVSITSGSGEIRTPYRIVDSYEIGASSGGAALGDNLYVANPGSNQVTVLRNQFSGEILASIPVGNNPVALAIDKDADFVYVSNFDSGTVSVIQAKTNTVIAEIPVGSNPSGITFSPNGSYVYVVDSASNDVAVIRKSDNTVLTYVPVGSNPTAISIDSNGTYAYVANAGSNDVSVIRLSDNVVTDTISAGNAAQAIAAVGNRVYVGNTATGGTDVIDAGTKTLLPSIPTGTAPNAIISGKDDGAFVYLHNAANNVVSIVRVADSKIIQQISVANPGGGAYRHAIGSNGYIVSGADNNVVSAMEMPYITADKIVLTSSTGDITANVKQLGHGVHTSGAGVNTIINPAPSGIFCACSSDVFFPPTPNVFSLNLSDPAAVSALLLLQQQDQAHFGGTLLVSNGIATGGELVIKPGAKFFIGSVNIPNGVTVTFRDDPAGASPLNVTLGETAPTAIVDGIVQFVSADGSSNPTVNFKTSQSAPALQISGLVSSDGSLALSSTGKIIGGGSVAAESGSLSISTTSGSAANIELNSATLSSTTSINLAADGKIAVSGNSTLLAPVLNLNSLLEVSAGKLAFQSNAADHSFELALGSAASVSTIGNNTIYFNPSVEGAVRISTQGKLLIGISAISSSGSNDPSALDSTGSLSFTFSDSSASQITLDTSGSLDFSGKTHFANPGTSTINALNGTVSTNPGATVSADGKLVINSQSLANRNYFAATGGVSGTNVGPLTISSLDLTDPDVVAFFLFQQQYDPTLVGGQLIASNGIATGGNLILSPSSNFLTLTAGFVPAGVVLSLEDFSSNSNPIEFALDSNSHHPTVVIDGTLEFKSATASSAVINISTSLSQPALQIGGLVSTDGSLSIMTPGNVSLSGTISADASGSQTKGGSISLTAASISVPSLASISANGDLAGGEISITSTSSGADLNFNNLTVSAHGTGGIAAGTGVYGGSIGINSGRDIVVDASKLQFNGTGAENAAGGSIGLNAKGIITATGNLEASATGSSDAGNITLNASLFKVYGDLRADAENGNGGNISITTTNSLLTVGSTTVSSESFHLGKILFEGAKNSFITGQLTAKSSGSTGGKINFDGSATSLDVSSTVSTKGVNDLSNGTLNFKDTAAVDSRRAQLIGTINVTGNGGIQILAPEIVFGKAVSEYARGVSLTAMGFPVSPGSTTFEGGKIEVNEALSGGSIYISGQKLTLNGDLTAFSWIIMSAIELTQAPNAGINCEDLTLSAHTASLTGNNHVSTLGLSERGHGYTTDLPQMFVFNNYSPIRIRYAGFGGATSIVNSQPITIGSWLSYDPSSGGSTFGDANLVCPEVLLFASLGAGGNLNFQSNSPDNLFKLTFGGEKGSVWGSSITFNESKPGPVTISSNGFGGLKFDGSAISLIRMNPLAVISTSGPLTISEPVDKNFYTTTYLKATGSIDFFGGNFQANNSAKIEAVNGVISTSAVAYFSVAGDLALVADSVVNPNAFYVTGKTTINVTGLNPDRTIVNPYGDILLTPNLTINSFGKDLAVIAAGSVIGSKLSTINLSSKTGDAGQLNIFAGVNFDPSNGPLNNNEPYVDAKSTFTIGSSSKTGGNINLAGTYINTSSSSPYNPNGASGGNVTLSASAGETNAGLIVTGRINSSSISGSGGGVTLAGDGGVIVSGEIRSTGKIGGGDIQLFGAAIAPGTIIKRGAIFSSNGVTEAPAPGSAIQVTGNIDTSSSLGAGGDLRAFADAKIELKGIIANGAAGGGNVSIISNNGSVSTGAISSKGTAAAGTILSSGGDLTVHAPGFIKINGNLILDGVTGGDTDLQTNSESNGYYSGNLAIKGYLSATGTAKDSNGSVFIRSGALQIRGSKSTKTGPASIMAGAVDIATYGTQQIPANFDLSSTKTTEYAMPGSIFNIGAAGILVNGTAGNIVSGSTVVKASSSAGGVNAGSIQNSEFQTDSVKVSAKGSTQLVNVDGVDTPISSASAGLRTKVTAGQALALYQLTRGELQSVGLNSAGQVTSLSPLNAAEPSSITVDQFDLPQSFISFNLKAQGQENGIQLNVVGKSPVLNISLAAVRNISGQISFDTAGHSAMLNSGTRVLELQNNSAIKADSMLVVAAAKVINNGVLEAGKIVVLNPGGKFMLENSSTGVINANGIVLPSSPGFYGITLVAASAGMPQQTTIENESSQFSTALLFEPVKLPSNFGPATAKLLTGAAAPLTIRISMQTGTDSQIGGAFQSKGQLRIDGIASSVSGANTNIVFLPGTHIDTERNIVVTNKGNISAGSGTVFYSLLGTVSMTANNINFENSYAEANKGLSFSAINGDVSLLNGSILSSTSGKVKITADDVVLGDNAVLAAGGVAGSPLFAPLKLSDIATRGNIEVLSNSISIGDNTLYRTAGGNIVMKATSGDISMGANNVFEVWGGNLILMSNNQFVGSTGNKFQAASIGASGGGIELGAGTTSSKLSVAQSMKSGTVNGPFAYFQVLNGGNSGVVQSNFSDGATGANLSVGSLPNQYALDLSGGAIVFNVKGSDKSIRLDGVSFKVSSLRPMSYSMPSAAELPAQGSPQKDFVKVADLFVKGRKGPQVLGVSGQDKFEAANIDLESGEFFICPTVRTTINTPVGKVSAKKGAILFVSTNEESMRVIDCGRIGDIVIDAGKSKIRLAPGEEIIVSRQALSKPHLQQDGLGRRASRHYKLESDVHVAICDLSIIGMLSSMDMLASLRHPVGAVEKDILNRILKSASVVHTVTSHRGGYESSSGSSFIEQ